MSKNEIPKKLSPRKIKNFTTRVGNFFNPDFPFYLQVCNKNLDISSFLTHFVK